MKSSSKRERLMAVIKLMEKHHKERIAKLWAAFIKHEEDGSAHE